MTNRESSRPDGLLPLRRLEEFLLRRLARARQRRRGVLYGAESNHEPVVFGLAFNRCR